MHDMIQARTSLIVSDDKPAVVLLIVLGNLFHCYHFLSAHCVGRDGLLDNLRIN